MKATEVELSYSVICPDFVKNFWKEILDIQACFTKNDLLQACKLENFQELLEHMKSVMSRSFMGYSFYFILGPITQVGKTTTEQHLMHFLCAYYFHCKNHRRKVFPQFLYTPIISNIAQKRIINGESSNVVMSSIMKDIHYLLLDFVKDTQSPLNRISGIWLEGYKNSRGAQEELMIFQEKKWEILLPEHTGHTCEFYTSSLLF